MEISGLHVLLTYQCNLECDHCFAWGSPWQSGTLSLERIEAILQQAAELASVKWIYFEGGEPFLYYATLLGGVQAAAAMGFQVGIVSNAYWAITEEDAAATLHPFAGFIQDLSVSSDLFHWNEKLSQQAKNAQAAAKRLGIPLGFISIAQETTSDTDSGEEEGSIMYRGRAVDKLAGDAAKHPWQDFTCCPYENLRDPGRIHLGPLGNLHICQGISLGNLFDRPLCEICADYDPDAHPIIGPLLRGGPAELVRTYDLPHDAAYADACHLCDQARHALRAQFPTILTPDQMYGVHWEA